jgi:photosynthetic reaction center cytochrome c subunit
MNSNSVKPSAHKLRAAIFCGAATTIALWFAIQVAAQSNAPVNTQMSAQASPENLPAEKVFTNIQVLKGMRAAEIQGAMSFIASSLGVDCDYCHRQNFGGDTVPAKLRAREMMLMVRGINEGTFHGANVVNCFTCHQGGEKPVSIAPILAASAAAKPPTTSAEDSSATAPTQAAALPSVDKILDRYVQALGGQAALANIKTRLVKTAALSGKSPQNVTEIYQTSTGKILRVQASPGYTSWAGFDGTRAWAQDSQQSYWGILSNSQRNEILRESEIYQGSRLRTSYTELKVTGKEKLGDKNTFVISGISPEGATEKFYFDAASGLLLRRHIDEPDIFGVLQVESDLEDYRDVDGVKIPYAIRWQSAGRSWGMRTSSKIVDIQNNISIDDDKFAHPPAVPTPAPAQPK